MKRHCHTEILNQPSNLIMHYVPTTAIAHRDIIIKSYTFMFLGNVFKLL